MTRFNPEAKTATGRNLFKDKKKKKVSERSSDRSPAVQLGEHGRYQIKSGRLSGEYVARAFPKPPTKARGLIAEARGATEEAAIAALHAVIDAREIRRTDGRRSDPTTGLAVPSVKEFVEAVGQVALSRPQRAMLTALSLADDEGLPEVRVASAAGYKSNASANRALASAGLLIASYLSLDATSDTETSDHDGTRFLGFRGRKKTKKTLGTGFFTPNCVKPLGLSDDENRRNVRSDAREISGLDQINGMRIGIYQSSSPAPCLKRTTTSKIAAHSAKSHGRNMNMCCIRYQATD